MGKVQRPGRKPVGDKHPRNARELRLPFATPSQFVIWSDLHREMQIRVEMTKPKSPLKCSIRGCKRPRRGGLWCEMHYYRHRRYGDFEKRGHPIVYDRSKTATEHLTEKMLSGVRKLKSGCWGCDTGVANPKTGYCEIVIHSKVFGKVRGYVHRLSFRHFKGPIPKGRHVCHSCDNPPCWNPEHLFAGTRHQNMQDMVDKGRHYRGNNNRKAFLTDADVVAMYRLQDAGGMSQYQIGKRFGVNERYVWLILHGRRWRYLYKKHRRSELMST